MRSRSMRSRTIDHAPLRVASPMTSTAATGSG
jgi:hypothetical protein